MLLDPDELKPLFNDGFAGETVLQTLLAAHRQSSIHSYFDAAANVERAIYAFRSAERDRLYERIHAELRRALQKHHD